VRRLPSLPSARISLAAGSKITIQTSSGDVSVHPTMFRASDFPREGVAPLRALPRKVTLEGIPRLRRLSVKFSPTPST
jgi:hypothetical protein